MAESIQSICIQDNNLTWIQGRAEGNQLIIEKVLESALPVPIQYDQLDKKAAPLQIANHLNYLAKANELTLDVARLTIPTKFGLIRKVMVDEAIPQGSYAQIARGELSYVLTSPAEDYYIYLPPYERPADPLKEILSVAVRKNLFQFFKKIADEAHFKIDVLTLNAFPIDHMYRELFGDQIGQVLLVNFTEYGFEYVLSDEKDFIHAGFFPFSSQLQSIQEVNEEEILAAFESMLGDFKNLGGEEDTWYAASQILVFGYFFQNNWLDQLEARAGVPVKILNPLESSRWEIDVQTQELDVYNAHRFIEPFANLLP
ncbi:MAG: hypothetical protein GXO78_04075 [Calditrichaeota bacterium]|nr:hypothetical protein [Calditrichota bacterium]